MYLDLSKTQIPPSTPSTIVFPYNPSIQKFETDHYTSLITDHHISIDDIENFLNEVASILLEARKGRGRRSAWICACLFILLMIAIAVSIPIVVELVSEHQIIMIYFGSIVVLVSLCVLALTWCCIRYNRKLKLRLLEMKNEIVIKVKQQNSVIEKAGFMWVIPEKFPLWIELSNQMVQNQGPVELKNELSQSSPLDIAAIHMKMLRCPNNFEYGISTDTESPYNRRADITAESQDVLTYNTKQ